MHSVSASEVISECALGCIGHFEVIGATAIMREKIFNTKFDKLGLSWAKLSQSWDCGLTEI